MTKDQFLRQLEGSLKKLPHDERQDILLDYEEHFTLGLEEGKSEEEIAKRLGSPNQLAKELLAAYHLEKVDKELTSGNILRAVWAVIGLGFFNLVIVLGPFIGLVGIIVGLWAAALGCVLSPLLALVNLAIEPSTFVLFDIFASIAFCGIGIFIGIGMFYVTKVVSLWFIRYLKYNASLVKGGMKHE